MGERVLVPWPEIVEGAPTGLRVDVYDGFGEPPVDVSDVAFYALPYARRDAEALLARMPGLRVAQLLTAGYEHVAEAVPEGAALCNGRGLHDASTAEHALALMLAAQRELPRWGRNQARHEWNPEFTRSLADSRILIVGYGSIGAAIDARLRACEAEVVRVARRARPEQDVHGTGDLHRLLPHAEIVVVVTPHTPETEGLMGARELALLGDGALVVNVGRGPVLDTSALLAEKGRIRAALDVTDPEPLPADHPLWEAPSVLITPHVAGGSSAFYPRAKRFVSAQLRRFAAGKPLENIVRAGSGAGSGADAGATRPHLRG